MHDERIMLITLIHVHFDLIILMGFAIACLQLCNVTKDLFPFSSG